MPYGNATLCICVQLPPNTYMFRLEAINYIVSSFMDGFLQIKALTDGENVPLDNMSSNITIGPKTRVYACVQLSPNTYMC